MKTKKTLRTRVGEWLSRYLSRPLPGAATLMPTDLASLEACLRPGDVLLVEGNTRVSTAIKYLTQSTWSHAALYVGDAYEEAGGGSHALIEADIQEGVRCIPVSTYGDSHCRICRPVGLTDEELAGVIDFAGQRLGFQYDLRHVADLARYLLPTPPVPSRWRRYFLALGSGDPTRAICSTLLAQAFQSIDYPILPRIAPAQSLEPGCHGQDIQVLYPRHYSHFVPRDFDVSPYFQVIKPTLDSNFDHRRLIWGEVSSSGAASIDSA
ncbi:YiiX/YebB-like N1pC/P60 family cysteine hydrolase [Halomonas halocynthiae]|uniref:YiiX/YebB-like N1pC/P60 family cysteine hydrolase n=1 Tax=Halomonas halocynthiae TaxID=176290 RepID=UPI00055407A3|nr:YiiX/YebB-like N1pC/P60 family cysteine hydrolase [Halomonas halocynthiae]